MVGNNRLPAGRRSIGNSVILLAHQFYYDCVPPEFRPSPAEIDRLRQKIVGYLPWHEWLAERSQSWTPKVHKAFARSVILMLSACPGGARQIQVATVRADRRSEEAPDAVGAERRRSRSGPPTREYRWRKLLTEAEYHAKSAEGKVRTHSSTACGRIYRARSTAPALPHSPRNLRHAGAPRFGVAPAYDAGRVLLPPEDA